jgi:hypothetical protein
MEIIWSFWALLGVIVGVIIGFRLKDDDIEDNRACDQQSLCGDNSSDDVSDNANSSRICDVRYLEGLQEEIKFMLAFSSPHEKDIIFQVSDVLDFMIEIIQEVEGISEEEDN